MAEQFTMEWAREVLDSGVAKAQSIIDDPSQVDAVLEQLQAKMKDLPDTVSAAFNNVPVMASMVKSYVTGEYTEVSPKVIVSLVGAFLYLLAPKDLIPDSIPVVGYADDLVIATFVMAINEPELRAFSEWKAQNAGEPIVGDNLGSAADIIDVPVVEA